MHETKTRDQAVHALIGMVYETIAAPDTWDHVLGEIASHLAASAGLFFNPAPGGPELLAQTNIIPGLLAEYVAYYHAKDVLVHSSLGREHELTGRALRIPDLMDEASFRGSEFCNDFLRRHAIADVLSSVIADPAMPAGNLPIISFFRPPDGPRFSHADARHMRVLLPHVQRALRLGTAIGRQAPEVPGWTGLLLEQLPAGILVIDGRGRLVHANRSARTILDRRDGLCLVAGKLTSPVVRAARSLEGAIAAALSPAPAGRDLRLARGGGGRLVGERLSAARSAGRGGLVRDVRSRLGACRGPVGGTLRAAAPPGRAVRDEPG